MDDQTQRQIRIETTPAPGAAPRELASQSRRLAGALLEVVLFVLTLGIGWIVWYLFVARNGQSPAKRLLGMRVMRDGEVANLGWMLIRDLAIRIIAFGALNGVLIAILGEAAGGAIYGLLVVIAALWCIWDARRRCLWDIAAGTEVVRFPR